MYRGIQPGMNAAAKVTSLRHSGATVGPSGGGAMRASAKSSTRRRSTDAAAAVSEVLTHAERPLSEPP